MQDTAGEVRRSSEDDDDDDIIQYVLYYVYQDERFACGNG